MVAFREEGSKTGEGLCVVARWEQPGVVCVTAIVALGRRRQED